MKAERFSAGQVIIRYDFTRFTDEKASTGRSHESTDAERTEEDDL